MRHTHTLSNYAVALSESSHECCASEGVKMISIFGFGVETKQIRSDLSSTTTVKLDCLAILLQSIRAIFDPILQPGVKPPLRSRE